MTIKGLLLYDEKTMRLEVVYADSDYVVFSYEDADEIWGTYYERYEDLPDAIQAQVPADWNLIRPIPIEVPIEQIDPRYLIIPRGTDDHVLIKAMAEHDLWGYCLDENGEPVELDSPRSPVYGLI